MNSGSGNSFDLLAVDLDGTLLDRQGAVPQRNRAALHRLHERGVRIVLCTGRSYTETRAIVEQLELDLDATMTVGGALISDARSGVTLESDAMGIEIARAGDAWLRERGYSVLWLHDGHAFGFDGWVLLGPHLHPAIERWLTRTPCRMRRAAEPPADAPAPLRLTIIDDMNRLDALSAEFAEVFRGRMNHNVIDVPTYQFTVLEAFAGHVDKWHGVLRLCRRWDIDPRRTVAVGDDVNDLSMLMQAGLGVAMGNARPGVLERVARRVAENSACGVAELIDQVWPED